MKNRAKLSLALLFSLCFLFPLFANEREEGEILFPKPLEGPWLCIESPYFRYIYKAAERDYLAELLSVEKEAYEIVVGFFKASPRKKPEIILYGSQDYPSFGGVTAPFPMRIGLVAPGSQDSSAKGLLVHEFTHYMQGERGDSGILGKFFIPFNPDFAKQMSIFLSEISIEGTTSFLDGARRREFSMLPVRAAVLEGRMWAREQASSASLYFPGALRVYFSGLLFHDWVHDRLGAGAYADILDQKNKYLLPTEERTVLDYTGLDMDNIWGEIRVGLEERWAFARDLPRGRGLTPRGARTQEQWFPLVSTERGYLHSRRSLDKRSQFGFWLPEALDKDKSSTNKGSEFLLEETGTFIPIKGLYAHDISCDSAATKLAVIINQAVPSALFHAENKNTLLIGDLVWKGEGINSSVSFSERKTFSGIGWSNPVLSPDGKRLWALQRFSTHARVVAVDMESGAMRPLIIPQDLHISTFTISPDGKKLALSFVDKGHKNIGLYDLETDFFTSITDDEAEDYYPRFLDDGRLVFSSDREDSIFVYTWDGENFYRLIQDAVGAWSPVYDGKGGFYYSSLSSEGNIIAHTEEASIQIIESFSELRPSWLERKNKIWGFYGKEGQTFLKKEAEKKLASKGSVKTAQSLESAEKLYIDIPRPISGFPLVSFDVRGLGLGLTLSGASPLQTSLWEGSFEYFSEMEQIAGSLVYGFSFPRFNLSLSIQEDFIGQDSLDGAEVWIQRTQVGAGASLPLLNRRSSWGGLFGLTLGAQGAWASLTGKRGPFSLVESFSLPKEESYLFAGGFSAYFTLPAPSSFLLGGPQIIFECMGIADKPYLDETLTPALRLRARGQIPLIGKTLLGFSSGFVWRENGGAWAFLPRSPERWESRNDFPYRLETGLFISNIAQKRENASPWYNTDANGFRYKVTTFFEGRELSTLRFIEEVDFEFTYFINTNFLYTPLLFEFSLVARISDRDPVFPDDLSLRFGVAGNVVELLDAILPLARANKKRP